MRARQITQLFSHSSVDAISEAGADERRRLLARQRALLGASKVLDRDRVLCALVGTLHGDERYAAVGGVLELPAQFIRFRIDLDAQAAAAELARQSNRGIAQLR